jgi:hypothetical protein
LKKSFPNLSKNFNLKPLCGFRKVSRFFISRELKPLQTRAKRGFVYAVERACARQGLGGLKANVVNLRIKEQNQHLGKLF